MTDRTRQTRPTAPSYSGYDRPRSTLHQISEDDDRLDSSLQDSLRLDNLERLARRQPVPSVLGAAALGYLLARSGLGGSPSRATRLTLSGAGDLAGGALKGTAGLAGGTLKGTAGLAGEALKGTGSLAAGALGAGAHLASGAIGAGVHLGEGVLEAGKSVTVGGAKAGLKLTGALISLLPMIAAVYLANAAAGRRGGRAGRS